ncbi:uncharacterized protein VP01_1231g2 [Puccinia sorghi]|uniref:Reverse transcriptase Ty1/copia-type domain-containing protein n=1 Tax=Puccinia sorghi TaxID=27349 RepID=A0A0L6VR93_9BASI|nr:uncharacterized protein VP01_1231g2 [Puccinia sorghi]
MTQVIITPTLMCDNNASVKIAKDNASNKRTHHSDHEFFYVNEQINKKKLEIKWIPTSQKLADIMTKSLGPLPFERIVTSLKMSGRNPA